eukprot:410782_1
MSSLALSSTQLFLLNGIVEGLVGLLAIVSPAIIQNVNRLHKHGAFYAGFFGPIIFAMGFVSVLMMKLPDRNNDAKHLFAAGWVIYHALASWNCLKTFLGGQRGLIAGFAFHSFLCAAFAMYLKSNNFKLDLLIPL